MFFPLVSSAQQQTPQLVDSDPMGVSCFNVTQPIRYGMRDVVDRNDVALLQDFLITNNFLSTPAPTGFFGRATFNAVKSFQSKYNIKPTGFVGQYTLAKIKDIDCNSASNIDLNPVSNSTATSAVVNLQSLPAFLNVPNKIPSQFYDPASQSSTSSTATSSSNTSSSNNPASLKANPYTFTTSTTTSANLNDIYVPVSTSSLVLPDFVKGYKYQKQ